MAPYPLLARLSRNSINLFFGLGFFALTTLAVAGEGMQAQLTVVKGRVEIIKANSLQWNIARVGEYIGHNDKLKVHDRARVEGAFTDGTNFILHEKSKILYNTTRVTKRGNSHKIFTLYQGSMYLNVQKPFENYEGHYTKVFVGPLSASTHEGSLIFEHSNEGSTPKISVLSGASKLFNSKDPYEKYFQGGSQVLLDTSGRYRESAEIEFARFARRVPWVGDSVIEKDLARGKLLQKRNQDIIAGTRHGRVVISEFEFKGEGLDNWDVGKYFSKLAAQEFSDVSYREFLLIESSETPPQQLIKQYEADRLVSGVVEKFVFDKKAVLNEETKKYELRLEVAFRLIVKIYDKTGEKLIKNAAFNGSLLGKKEEALILDEFIENPLDENNKIMTAETFVKIIESLKKRLRKFAKFAV